MKVAAALLVAMAAASSGGCLDAKQGGVEGVADTASEAEDTAEGAADTEAPTDSSATADTTSADANSEDTAAEDTATEDASAEDAVVTPGGCCQLAGYYDGMSALDPASCAAQCGQPVDLSLCADPPVCCELPDGHVTQETASGCAALQGAEIDGEECDYDQTVCCAWPSGPGSLATEVYSGRCAQTGGHEVLGDICWDQHAALGRQCCQLPDGDVRVVADYQCEPEGGALIPWLDCWAPPEDGVCCALRCGGVAFTESAAACADGDGAATEWTACDPKDGLAALPDQR